MARSGMPARERIALPSGVTVTKLRGRQPGPTVSVLGGVHGDEDEGVLAVLRVLDELATSELTGTVNAVPVANPTAWAAHSRTSPLDDGNLARCFPGAEGTGPTEQVADDITTHVIDGVDLLIDLHSAGLRYRMPLLSGFVSDVPGTDHSRRAAEAFGAPLIWAHPDAGSGRSLSIAAELGVPAIYAESSGGGSIRQRELDVYVSGVLSVLADLAMVPETYRTNRSAAPRWVYGSGDLDTGKQSKHDGFFVNTARAGDVVDVNDEIGLLYDYHGRLVDTVRAPRQGVVMFLRRQARTRADDVLFVLADLNDERA